WARQVPRLWNPLSSPAMPENTETKSRSAVDATGESLADRCRGRSGDASHPVNFDVSEDSLLCQLLLSYESATKCERTRSSACESGPSGRCARCGGTGRAWGDGVVVRPIA